VPLSQIGELQVMVADHQRKLARSIALTTLISSRHARPMAQNQEPGYSQAEGRAELFNGSRHRTAHSAGWR
jgi:hypothetical protein